VSPHSTEESDGTWGIKLSPLEHLEKLAALVPPPQVHQVRDGGGLAAPSKRRGAIIPDSAPAGCHGGISPDLASLEWGATAQAGSCPRHGSLPPVSVRRLADHRALTYWPIISRIVHDLQLAADPPLLAPARWEPVRVAWVSASSADSERGFGSEAGAKPVHMTLAHRD